MATNNTLLNIFCENVQYLEEVHGLSGKDVAKRLGMTPGSYSDLKKGRYSPTITTISKIATAFGIPAEQLLTPLERHARVGA